MILQKQTQPVSTVILFKCAVKNQDDQYLLIKKKSDAEWNANKWEFPGGKVRPREDPFKGLKRKVMEETGLNIIWIYPTVFLKSEVIEQGNNAGDTLLRIAGETDQYDGVIKLGDEHTEYRWVSPKEFLDMDMDLTDRTREVFEYLNFGK
ncbi:NUDIX domain-containing protein [bacterium]|nr:NUDIX domain-containing protein [bacterium]